MRIVILGSGNVATHMSKALFDAGFEISQIYSRNIDSAKLLANEVNAEFCNVTEAILLNADVYIYAIKDDAIKTLLSEVKNDNGIHIHVSGSTNINIFEGAKQNFGVIYPLQTLSKNKAIDFSSVPLFVEANNAVSMETIWEISNEISGNVRIIDSQQRQSLHVAAVFACNFSNYLCNIAYDVLKNNGLEFELLHPLIAETAAKLKTLQPYEAQTGPAVRFDKQIIDKHMDFLSENEDVKNLYVMLSKMIYQKHNKTNE
jgi:predicted short-subunit dehydrogenase-like oxidoreductase (DUF2520 family)